MKTNLLKYGLMVALAWMSVTSCSDFMDTTQPGVTSQENFYQTDDEALQALYAIYDKVQYQQLCLYTFEMKNLLSDDAQAGGGSRSDNSQGNELNEFTFSASNSLIEYNYEWYWQIIYRANVLLQNVDDDSDVKHICRAEAYCLRAWAYFELITLWGNVPLVTEPLEAGNYNQPNSTLTELWAQVEEDLEYAISELPVKSQHADAARVCKGTAQSMLGKAYLFQEKYDEAASMFDNVINSGEYSLYPDFADITKEASEFGVESVFEISYSADVSSPLEGTMITAYCGPRSGYFSAGTSGLSESGWGFVNPLPGLRELYIEEGDLVRQLATVIDEDDLETYYGGTFRSSDGSWPYGCDGLIRTKYGAYLSEIAEEEESYHCLGGTNYRIIRYADVLLMAAEAYNRKSSSNDSKAQDYVNQVRARVGLDGISSTGDDLFEDIKKERRLELAFEFVRFQDLVRWGEAATVLADQGKSTSLGTFSNGEEQFYTNSEAGFKSYNVLLPYPEAEITVNPNITQNTGY